MPPLRCYVGQSDFRVELVVTEYQASPSQAGARLIRNSETAASRRSRSVRSSRPINSRASEVDDLHTMLIDRCGASITPEYESAAEISSASSGPPTPASSVASTSKSGLVCNGGIDHVMVTGSR